MARASKIATKPKKKVIRSVRRGSNRFPLMPDKGITWNKAKFYTHYEVESSEWLERIKTYIKNNYDKKTVSSINKLPDWQIGGKSHWACTAYCLEKIPEIVPIEYKEGIHQWITSLSEAGSKIEKLKKEEEKSQKNIYKPSIQERITEQSQEACDAIEEWLETYITDAKNFDPKGFDFSSHFTKFKVSQAHARKIKNFYQGWFDESKLVENLPTPAQIKKIKDPAEAENQSQLREGYSHVKKADAKKWREALENLLGACDLIIDTSKAARKPRAKKAPSKEKLISKLKYKDKDEKYQIVSVNPLELIDCSEVWTFNIKTRKLGRYVLDEHSTSISVKGTSLVGFSESKSLQKTLRKPEETLKEFKKAGKVKLRKFLEEINAVETKLNGRLNADTIILRVS